MATITCLNIDTISIILSNNNISIEDIFNFTSTCKSLYGIVDEDNMFWKRKMFQRWLFLKNVYGAFKGYVNFKDQVKDAMKCRNKLWNYLSHLSEKHCYNCVRFGHDWNSLYDPEKDSHYTNFYLFKAELINLFQLSSEKYDCDLTQKYYAKQVLLHIQKQLLIYNWRKFSSSYKEQIVEETAIAMAKLFQPLKHISDSNIKTSLNNIIEKILEHILKKYPKHPIFMTPIEPFSSFDINNNQWCAEEGGQIIRGIEEILYEGYTVQERCYLEHFCIDYVLENKIGDILCIGIIFQCVARRLGMHCELALNKNDDINLLNFSFYLIWKPKYFHVEETKFFCINITRNMLAWEGRDSILERYDIEEIPSRNYTKCIILHNPTQYFDMVLELNYCDVPTPIDTTYFDQKDIFKICYISQEEISCMGESYVWEKSQGAESYVELNDVREALDEFKEPEVCDLSCQQRTEEIKYSVGQVVKIKNSRGVQLVGVIIGWILPPKKSLPLYTILGENNKKVCGISQEDMIEIISPEKFNPRDIGQYFCRREKNHYVPNQILTNYFPYELTVSPKHTSPSQYNTSPVESNVNGRRHSDMSLVQTRSFCMAKWKLLNLM